MNLEDIADDAFISCFPLVEMARMRAANSPRSLPDLGNAGDGPDSSWRWCNRFKHARTLLSAGGSRVVTPNNDTLYSTGWFDLADGPLVLRVPDTQGRYHVLGLLDFWTNPFAHLGTRLHGHGGGDFVLSGPGWQGALASELAGRHVRAGTRWVWIIVRWLVDGPDDCAAVHRLQDALQVLRLGADGRACETDPVQRFDTLFDAQFLNPQVTPTTAHFVQQVNRALRDAPVPEADQTRFARYTAVGLGADQPDTPRPALLDLWRAALPRGLQRLRDASPGPAPRQGWILPPVLGTDFGSDHQRRAVVAMKYIGALESAEAHYPMAWHDMHGQPLTGERAYRLRFAPGQLPPVDGFWSITMYDQRDFMLVANPIDRYAIGDRSRGLVHDADGGLTLCLQHSEPRTAEARANWLPAPAGLFYICLRAYLPQPALLSGHYAIPGLAPLDTAA